MKGWQARLASLENRRRFGNAIWGTTAMREVSEGDESSVRRLKGIKVECSQAGSGLVEWIVWLSRGACPQASVLTGPRQD